MDYSTQHNSCHKDSTDVPGGQQVNRVADAAELLRRFCDSPDLLIPLANPNDSDDLADNRAVLIAVQLLAIASQAERIADALDRLAPIASPTSPGKTHTVESLLRMASVYGGKDPES